MSDPPKHPCDVTVVRLPLELDIGDASSVFMAMTVAGGSVDLLPGKSDEAGALISVICQEWLKYREESAANRTRPASPANAIEINPEVAGLLERAEINARDFEDPKDVHTFFPQLSRDLRRMIELIRFGANATGQPAAGGKS